MASAPSQTLLPSPQGQQSRVGGENLGHGRFKLLTRVDQTLNLLDPFVGDAFHVFLAPGHEGERPNGVPLLVGGTVASGPTATAVGERERTGQQVGGNGEAAKEIELALAESSGLRAFRSNFYMSVIIHTAKATSKGLSGMRK